MKQLSNIAEVLNCQVPAITNETELKGSYIFQIPESQSNKL